VRITFILGCCDEEIIWGEVLTWREEVERRAAINEEGRCNGYRGTRNIYLALHDELLELDNVSRVSSKNCLDQDVS